MSKTIQAIKASMRQATLPRPRAYDPSRLGEGPLVIAGMFKTANGIGRAARACFDTLTADGLNPIAVDLSDLLNQVDQTSDVPLSPMPKTKTGTLILFANAPETERALSGLGLHRLRSWQIIGCWAWELSTAPPGWARQARFLSEIWTPSRFVSESLGAGMPVSVRTVPHHVRPLAVDRGRSVDSHRAGEHVTFLTMADGRSSFPRKNILATIEMFRAAFDAGERARLVVKCRNLDLFRDYQKEVMQLAASDSRIEVIDRSVSMDEHRALMESSDVLVSAHRSEGFGLHLAEAMAMGLPVVATAWSGNLEFMTSENSILLPYSLTRVEDPTGVYPTCEKAEWADVDIGAGVKALRDVFSSPDYRDKLAEAGRHGIASALRGSVYRDALFRRA